ncbi:MAG TPA: hypothetical protein VG603_13765, partial [Chitinophagales bacterium]|nr:hypothetical protein [Chitinophagales bacterium]
QTGEITFETLLSYFDMDFPGHYLRLIKQVKVSVIALIPPTQGIKATLLSSGNSHVVIGGQTFQDTVVRRSPEMVALSGTRDATGVFSLQMQDPKLLNPFEDTGVHTRWELKMPKASNQFDYNSVSDVLFTIDYTALYDSNYEQQVIRELGTDFSADQVFSFKDSFADEFYVLCHPEESDADTAMKANIQLSVFDFPANVSDLEVEQVKLYFLIQTDDPTFRPFIQHQDLQVKLSFQPDEEQALIIKGNAKVNKLGIISTLTNGGGFINAIGHTPLGTWQFDMKDLQDLFTAGNIYDVVLAVTYSGTVPTRS